MKLNKILSTIALGTSLALSGCYRTDFDGKIGDERVKLSHECFFDDTDILKVTRKDGKIIVFEYDMRYNPQGTGLIRKVDRVFVFNNGTRNKYVNDELGSVVLQEADKQYTQYMTNISEAIKQKKLDEQIELKKKQAKALEDISR